MLAENAAYACGVMLRAVISFQIQVAMDIAWPMRLRSRRMHFTMEERGVLLRAVTNFQKQVAMLIA